MRDGDVLYLIGTTEPLVAILRHRALYSTMARDGGTVGEMFPYFAINSWGDVPYLAINS